MAVENVSFGATVEAWAKASEQRLDAVFRESCQDLVEEVSTPVGAGGNMPVVTNFLRSSGVATEGAPTPMRPDARPEDGGSYTFSAGQAGSVIAGLKVGNVFYWCYVAVYARRVEYKRGFVRLAAQRWQQIVNAAAQRVRAQVGG